LGSWPASPDPAIRFEGRGSRKSSAVTICVACSPPHAKAAASCFWRPRMLGIGVIVIFLVVIGALNFYEFGRLD
jgi:hypothetical protein